MKIDTKEILRSAHAKASDGLIRIKVLEGLLRQGRHLFIEKCNKATATKHDLKWLDESRKELGI